LKFPLTALQALVVLPGAMLEGALAVVLPWLVVQAAQGTVWLGPASAGLVAAGLLGTLLAPGLEGRLGNRRMTLATAYAATAALFAAGGLWAAGHLLAAYSMALLSLAADAACDVGFTSRLPLIARLARQRLERLSAGNWLWAIPGAALGSLMAGAALEARWANGPLAMSALLAVIALLAAVALTVLMPGKFKCLSERQRRPSPLREALSRGFWTRPALRLAAALGILMFFGGPLDNLLLPAHLNAGGWSAASFGHVLAVSGLGLALGLAMAQSAWLEARRDAVIVVGLLSLAGQLMVLAVLPSQVLVLACAFVGAVLFAPLLPWLEAAMLRAALPAQRTLMVSVLSMVAALADLLGSVVMGSVVSAWGSTWAIGLCAAVALMAVGFVSCRRT
jgi:predicted MFS family arabinose efflux permease